MSVKPFKSTWPRVVRSPEVDDGTILAIDGVQFEDGLRRIVVGVELHPDGVRLIEDVLRQIDYMDDHRKFLESALGADVEVGSQSYEHR